MIRSYRLIGGVLLAMAVLTLRVGAVDAPGPKPSALDQEIAELQRAIENQRREAADLDAKLQALLKQRRELAAAKAPAIEPDARLAILSVAPNDGAAGAMLTLRGRGFAETKKVTFIAGTKLGTIRKDATFKVISDTEITVIAPEILKAGTEAAIFVHAAAGVTVSTPQSSTKIFTEPGEGWGSYAHAIRKGGVVATGGVVSLVDDGGILVSPSVLTLVKKGGRLAKSRAQSHVYYERGALLDGAADERKNQVEAPLVTISPLKSLFMFTAPKHAAGESKSPPRITSITPDRGQTGDIIELRGKGFLGTTSVTFEPHTDTRYDAAAGFHIVSDEVLRVEVTRFDNWRGGASVIVVHSPQGLTLAMGKDTPKIADAENDRHAAVTWVTKGGVVSSGGGGRIYLIDEGGILLRSGGGSCTSFVKDGGTLMEGMKTYYEPKATLGEKVPRENPHVIEVPSISASLVDRYFNAPEKK